MLSDKGRIAGSLCEKINPFFDAEMVPAGNISNVAAVEAHLFQSRNQRISSLHDGEPIEVSLSFKVANKKAK